MSDKDSASNPSDIVYEASWAPEDPRDRMYDQDASAVRKVGAFVRIIGSYHPVLNLPILAFDLLKKLGLSSLLFLLLILPALVGAFVLL
ncbi:hypothetical protein KFE96_11695 [Kordiimonas sp. SCSIO 12603]|uniref:hypothetical protein n=1 Tax=Kordiimonas sp. SCSIO 12603 TaxID=2829596 RepID=UPI002104DD4C|nr:hypothetical protein [Kordiimonas sp. SCSIO 12603]UTW57508.1 hypothetical protein KFE96_11695 [Kordiimonas sp. SCSIO 12603]